ncbi:L-2-hydroxyglutarate oxidase [Rhodococcus aerolatus]
MADWDFCVVGGGIVGLATARALQARRPGASVLVLEKETGLAVHQTGHNSGVIHSGLYYEPGSLKARLCVAGARATKEFCAEHAIPVRELGKLVVATDAAEASRLGALAERGAANGVRTEPLTAAQLREWEPAVAGVAALHVPVTASVDYGAVTRALRTDLEHGGGRVETGVAVTGLDERTTEVVVRAGERSWTAGHLVVCAGLQADRLARAAGVRTAARVVPFRGEYYRLPEHRAGIVSRLVYPVPDPSLPFLGVHLTPMVDGSTTVGPNAVLGLAREGYRKGSVDARDVREILGFPGFWRVARTHWRTGVREVRGSASRRAYLAAARRYCPGLELDDLLPQEAGIRAQAVLPDGTLVHDFLLERTPRSVHVLNAPSPAATSALPIGEAVADRLLAA